MPDLISWPSDMELSCDSKKSLDYDIELYENKKGWSNPCLIVRKHYLLALRLIEKIYYFCHVYLLYQVLHI